MTTNDAETMADRSKQDPPFARVLAGVLGFANEMRAKDIHVGMGRNPHCVTCGESWPCSASQAPA